MENDQGWQNLKSSLNNPEGMGENVQEIAEIIQSLLERNHFASAGDLINKLPDPLPDQAELLLAVADYWLSQNQLTQAKQLAVRALEISLNDPTPPERLSSTLLKLEMPEESALAAQQYLQLHPNHRSSHLDHVEAMRQQGNYQEAAKGAQVLRVLFPNDISLQRKLAGYLEEAELWKDALEIRAAVLSKLQSAKEATSLPDPFLPKNDLLAFARCAYAAEQPNRAVSACTQILAQDQDNCTAFALRGKSLFLMGKQDEGLAHLNRALELNPELEESWLALADCQIKSKAIDQVRQTLHSGINAAATKSRLLLALGQIETQNHHYSKALETFQQANKTGQLEEIDPKTAYEIELGIGSSYYELGYLDQARDTLKELNKRFPANGKGNAIYGKLLLGMDDPKNALPFLIQSIDKYPHDAENYLHYADALLRIGKNPRTAVDVLGKALEIDPANEIAQVLLAEAQAAEGNYQQALLSFRKAQESSLKSNPSWSPRICAGLGKAAIKLGEIDTAIASLKDGHDRYPNDFNLTRSLAEAYQAGELTANALDAAKHAAEIKSDDPDHLAWVARFTLELGSPEQGISALKKLIRINPENYSAYITLGKAQASAGNEKEAAASLAAILKFEDVQPEDLLLAGEELIKLGQVDDGMKSLAKAKNICEANPEPSPLLPKIWSCQAAGFELNGEPQKALELLDQTISAELDQPEWRIQKADLLIKQDRYQAAIASLSNALDLSPDEPALHTKMARVQRTASCYEEAFHHAQEALSGYQSDSTTHQDQLEKALALAADLACATLRNEVAEELLSNLDPDRIPSENPISETLIHSFCLTAELALNKNQEVKAAGISNFLVSRESEHPRADVLQARILNRQGSLDAAQEKFASAVEHWHQASSGGKSFSTAVEIAFANTAQEIQQWDQAAAHLQHAADLSPREKRVLFEMSRFYIERAEIRRLSEVYKIIHRAPSQVSLSPDVYKSFQGCIEVLTTLEVDPVLVRKLKTRGDALFSPSQETADTFKPQAVTTGEVAALIGAYQHSRQKVFASQTALDHLDDLGKDSRLDIQIAQALLKIRPDTAYKAASSALETAKRKHDALLPIYFVQLALSAKQIGDLETAEETINKALQLWDDEPRWYALAAELTRDYTQAAKYYLQAIDLEPEYTNHYLALGKLQLKAKQALSASKSFEKVISINPEHIDAWIQRALCKKALHRMPEALASINQALSLAPDHKDAQKTAAWLTFENGSYRESEKHLVSLLGQDPNDTDLLALFARTLAAQKQSEQALRVIEKAISLEKDSLALELQKALMIKQINGPLAAVDELRIIGSRFPNRYPLVIELVTTLAEAGEMNQAIQTAQEILLNDDLGYTPEQKGHLYLITGRLLRQSGQLDQAVHHLHKAKKLVNPNYEAQLELGRVHHDRRQYDLALDQMEKAIKIEPEEAEGYYQAGLVLKELKRYERAERMLRKASQLAPNDLKIHRQLGVLVTLNLVHGDSRKEVMA